jgi:methylase of polypeptide subunit release factors
VFALRLRQPRAKCILWRMFLAGDQNIAESQSRQHLVLKRASVVSDSDYDHAPAEHLILRHRQIVYPYECKFGRADLVIDEGVFIPTLTRVSSFLLDCLEFESGQRVLDMFAGSGAFAINAALYGARAVAVDNSPAAVACARNNALHSHVQSLVDVRLGTIGSLSGEDLFDVVVANPPLLPGAAFDDLTSAIYDPGLQATLGFIRSVRRHLAADGRCYLVTSSVLERLGYDVDQLSRAAGLLQKVVDKLDVGYETYSVHEMVSAF